MHAQKVSKLKLYVRGPNQIRKETLIFFKIVSVMENGGNRMTGNFNRIQQ